MVSGILRLSTKYLCDNLRAKALAHLSVAWPYNIRGWDAREDVARCYEMEALENTGIYPSPIVSPVHNLECIMNTNTQYYVLGRDKASK